MSTTFSIPAFRPGLSADAAMKAAAGFWFVVLVIGQVIFAVSVALFYGLTALHGNFGSWSKHLAQGYVEGDGFGNAILVTHIASAVLIILSGALQFSPMIRARAPRLHRWNGRFYIFTSFSVSLAGLYLLVFRGPSTSIMQRLATGVLAIVVMVCAAMALRYALKRDFATHRRWAFRLFLVVSAALFIRASVTLTAMVAAGTGTFDVSVVQGSFLTVISFAQFCVPLAVLEVFFWVQRRGGAAAQVAMAAALVAITLVMGAGIAAASVGLFIPSIRAGLDPRPSIEEVMARTIKSSGVEAAVAQYHQLQAMRPRTYNFDEDELNALGYDLMHSHQYKASIRVLQLNTETYPASGNTWDSLGEAYMDAGNVPAAVANYRKSLAINPGNRNAVRMLQKMNSP